MQYFYIKKDSVLPTLRMDLIEDGRHDFHKFHECIQAADITFTMVNIETKVTKVAKGRCYIALKEDDGCQEKYAICYDWKKRDTKEEGTYEGTFTIEFSDKVSSESVEYPYGTLIMPIREPLYIVIQ